MRASKRIKKVHPIVISGLVEGNDCSWSEDKDFVEWLEKAELRWIIFKDKLDSETLRLMHVAFAGGYEQGAANSL
jgi:hypothetical protein